MTSYQDVKVRTLDILNQTAHLATDLENPRTAKHVVEAVNRLQEGRLLAVVCGEAKQGKSTLLNALLAEPGLFPEDVSVTTSLVTTVTYGDPEMITVIFSDPEHKPEQITRDRIREFVVDQENPDNRREAAQVIIQTPNIRLQDGLILVDTPGVGGLDRRHLEVTRTYIPNADAVIFVSDAKEGLTTSELDFVKQIIKDNKTLIHVLTKIDVQAEYKDILEMNRNKLAQFMGKPVDQVMVAAVSSRNKLDYLKSGDEEDLHDSHFTEFERMLWETLLQKRGSILVARAVGICLTGLAELAQLVNYRSQAYRVHTEQSLSQMEDELNKTKARLKQLQNRGERWQTQLTTELKLLGKSALEDIKRGFRKLQVTAEEYIDDDQLVRNIEQIVKLVEIDIGVLLDRTLTKLGGEAHKVMVRLIQTTQLPLAAVEDMHLDVKIVNADIRSANRTPIMERILSSTRQATLSTGTGVLLGTGGGVLLSVGTIVAAIVTGGAAAPLLPLIPIFLQGGPLVGGAVGALQGLAKGIRQVDEQDIKRAKLEYRTQMRRYFDKNKDEFDAIIDTIVTNIESEMTQELLQKLTDEENRCAMALEAITESRKSTTQERNSLLKQEEARLVRIQKLDGVARAILQDVNFDMSLPEITES